MSIRCPRCGQDNQKSARFCRHCSQSLVRPCPDCGTEGSASARFCPKCGGTLAQPNGYIGVSPGGPLTGRLSASALLASRYRIVRKLGEGGMAAVYLTEDMRLPGKHWAVKEMTDAALTSTADRLEAVQAFRQEAQLLAGLDHPNLPKVIDSFSEGGNQYLVMEYVDGQTLGQRFVQNGGPLPENQVVEWAEKLCGVLTYLHNLRPSIVFRDLKPDNIMVRRDGELKLIDFGIARHFKPGQRKDTQAIGTIGYAPPEQHGKGQTDVRSDIYALGATLHHLLTGQDPSENLFDFVAVRTVNPAVSQSLDETIAKAVRLDPNERWQSMESMRQALRPQAVPAGPGSPMPAPKQPYKLPMVQRTPAQTPRAMAVPDPSNFELLPQVRYASYGKRIAATLLDGLFQSVLWAILFAPLLFILSVSMNDVGVIQENFDIAIRGVAIFVSLFIWFVYLIRPTARSGKTLGKRLVGIRVVNRQNKPPGRGRTLVRYVLGFGIESALSGLLIGILGFLWPLWDDRGQAWHDKIAGTFVVEE